MVRCADEGVNEYKCTPIEGSLAFTHNMGGELTSNIAINDIRYWIRIPQKKNCLYYMSFCLLLI